METLLTLYPNAQDLLATPASETRAGHCAKRDVLAGYRQRHRDGHQQRPSDTADLSFSPEGSRSKYCWRRRGVGSSATV